MNIEKLSPEQRKMMFQALTAMQLQETQESLNMMSLELKRTNEKITEIEESQKQIADKNFFIQNRAYGDDYVNVSLLGDDNEPKVSNRRMNKLLCVVGITMKEYSSTWYEMIE